MSWPLVKASDVIDVRDGTHDSPKYIESGIPLVTSKNLVDGGIDYDSCQFISEEDHVAISKRSAVDSGDILYAMIGTIGNPVIVEKRFDFSIKNVALFKFNNNSVFNRYVYHFLNSEGAIRQLLQQSRGGTQKFVSLGNLRDLKIPLPPFEEQKRIAAILDKADAIRRKRQQAIKLADDFLRSVFLEMFGDPVSNPKGWDIVELADIVSEGDRLNYGVVQPGDNNSDGIPLVRSGDLSELTPEINSLRRVSHAIDQKHKKSKLKGNEILIACVGSIGKVGWVTEQMKGWNIARAVTRIPIKDGVNREYIYRYLQSPIIQGYFEKETRAVAQPTLNVGLIAKTPIALPPIELQIEYLKIVSRISTIKEKFNSKGEVRLFESVSQKAFSGQL